MADVGLIYLYRFSEGEAPARRFFESYCAHPAGISHDRAVVLKGFPDPESLARGRALFGDVPIKSIELEDSGYDIGSYVEASRLIPTRRLVFLNTFSQILADDWLQHFDDALNRPGTGLVGATGSWAANTAGYEATITFLVRRMFGLPAQYYQSFDCDQPEGDGSQSKQNTKRSLKPFLFAPFDYLLRLYRYGRYPNPHIRTNAFMIDRDRFLSLEFPAFKAKSDTYKFESGRGSLTEQLLRQKLNPVVVDRCGNAYDIPEWKSSLTFRIGEQTNLVVADNRTVDYAQASAKRRQYLEKLTWVHPWEWDRGSIDQLVSFSRRSPS
jgi:hypothetical protein